MLDSSSKNTIGENKEKQSQDNIMRNSSVHVDTLLHLVVEARWLSKLVA